MQYSSFYRLFIMSSSSRKQNANVAVNDSPHQHQKQHKSTGSAGRSCSSTQKDKKKKARGDFTLDRINDIVDFETEHIMMERENRQEHFDTLMVCSRW